MLQVNARLAKKADAAGLTITPNDGRFEVRKNKKIISYDIDAKTALKKALEQQEAERIAKVDPCPEDREPLLLVAPRGQAAGGPTSAPDIPRLPGETPPTSDDATIPLGSRSIIKSKYKDKYKKNGFTCGDDVADELRAYIEVRNGSMVRIDLEKLKEVAVKNEVWKESYAGLNPGQQRMTIGNRLRSRMAQGDQIDIGGAILEAPQPQI